ncbi:MAG: hypothetical protein ACTSYM_07685 [Candidatus Baldrarchaeia archaeon]
MRRTTTKKLKTTAIILIVLSMTLIPALTSPIFSPVVICFGNDEAVKIAREVIVSRVPAIVLSYNNPWKHLYLIRAQTVIYIGHGGEKGIHSNKLVTWNQLRNLIETTPAKHSYILACNSYQVAEEIDRDDREVIGFKGVVDAELGALAVVALISWKTGNQKVFQEAFTTLLNKFFKKLTKIEKTIPLFYMKGKVYYAWFVPYRWQIWWKFGEHEAWNLIHDLQKGAEVAAAIASAIGVFDVIAGLLLGIFLAGQMAALASAFSEALDHSSGTLIFYIDVWGTLTFGFWYVQWLDTGQTKIASLIPQSSFGSVQAGASMLPSDWTWYGYYSGVT